MKKTKLTRSLLAACSIVALSAVAYGCSSGISQSEADRQAAEAAAAAQAEAEAAAAAAAAEAAAAAAAAAAEAAAQAEAEKLAAVEAARQAAIAEQQKMAVMAAIATAMASVDALMDDSSDVDVTAAMADIAEATAAIAAASSFSADDTAMYGAQVTAIQANLALAQANIRAYRAEMAAEEAMNQATAAERAKTAVENAIAALTAASEAEDTAEATYSDAADTLEAAQQAVADADAESLAEASGVLAEALIAASTAAADLSVKTQAVAEATAALMAARATLAEADPDHVALQAANAALAQAQADKDELAKKVEALQAQIDALIKKQAAEEKARMEAAAEAAREAEMRDATAAGKALYAALGTNPLGNIEGTVTITTSGLMINPEEGPGVTADSIAEVTLEAVEDSEDTLGDWNSMEYAHSDSRTKITNDAMVFTNQAAPKSYPIASRYAVATNVPSGAGTYTAADRMLSLGDAAGDPNIKADMFPTAGQKTFTPTAPSNENLVSGTYQGASGVYRCTGTCTATATADGIQLSTDWVFVHDMGAEVEVMDSAYLYFGWWLRKDDGDPTHASAFMGKVGLFLDDNDDDTEDPLTGVNAIVGSATYTGAAAGKFAINDPINGGDAGHFTADATLTAKFSGNGAGLTGTINNFMANDKAVPWSVALNNTGTTGTDAANDVAPSNNIGADGAIAAITDNAGTATVDESLSTVWSIDGNAAAAYGTWRAQMYDEKPGNADTPPGDGSNVPTSVTGVFQSMFGSTHTMVGGFGAEKQ